MTSVTRQLDVAGDRLRIIQITDTHLCPEPGGTLLGLDTDYSLQQVIGLARREHPDIDLVLATGDIADSGSASAYRRAAQYFAALPAETVWLAGNHDCADTMARELGDQGRLTRVVRGALWQVVMLNSQVPGEVGGTLGPDEIDWLRQVLDEGHLAGLHTLVCLHHQPLPMGSAWIDEQQVSDADAFWAVIDGCPSVRGVLWGHVHQQRDDQRGPVQLMATPSSCVQFAPGATDFRLDDQPPGFRWLDLNADGSISTGIVRVTDVSFDVDLDSRGYAEH